MGLIINNDLGDQPGVHVFIVGVSDYPNLPLPGQPSTPGSFGLKKLASPALSAYRVYQWVHQQANNFSVPMASCRLLISPSDQEIGAESALSSLAQDTSFDASYDNFLQEITDWQRAVSTHKKHIAIFYFSGHGVVRGRGDAVLLLKEYGEGIGGVLRHGVELNNIYYGLAPSVAQPQVAQNQFYFIDACRNLPSQFENFQELTVPNVFNVLRDGTDYRCVPIFFATLPGTQAYGIQGEQTLFSKKMLTALKGEAGETNAEDDQGNAVWNVTVRSFNEVMSIYFPLTNDLDKQSFTMAGQTPNLKTEIVALEGPPLVNMSIYVDPDAFSAYTKVKVIETDTDRDIKSLLQVDPNPYTWQMLAGTYTFFSTFQEDPIMRKTRMIKPPNHNVPIRIRQ